MDLWNLEMAKNPANFKKGFAWLDRNHSLAVSQSVKNVEGRAWVNDQADVMHGIWVYIRRGVMRRNQTKCEPLIRLKQVLSFGSDTASAGAVSVDN